MEIQDITNNLDIIRKSKDLWSEFKYSEPDNYKKRYALAIALQYDYNPDDLELVRFLMENEVKSRENDPYQGIGNTLTLISYLLAKFKRPENVWLFEKAKCANFDTYCGYESEFIFSAGVEATCKYLESCEITEINGYLYPNKDNLRSLFTEDHINKFLNRIKLWYPDNIKDESTESLFGRAIEFNNFAEGERLFRLLEEEETNEQSLYYYAKSIKRYDKAIYYQTKLLKKANNGWDRVSALYNIAYMYCLNMEYISAYKTAMKWDKMLVDFRDWIDTSLGRALTETWFDISLGLYQQNKYKLSLCSFKYGDEMGEKIKTCTYCIYEKAKLCSEKLGLVERENYYRQMMIEERKRIDAELTASL